MSIPEQSDPWHLPEQSPPSSPTDGGDAAGWLDPNQPPPPQRVRRRPFRVATAWILIALSTFAIMVMQFIATQLPPPPPADTQPALDTVLVGRIAVGFKQVLGQSEQGMLLSMQAQAAESPYETTAQLRVAVIAGELGGSAEAYESLSQLSPNNLHSTLEPASDFNSDHELLLRIYGSEAYAPNAAESQGLIQRHGWFGQLAAGYNLSTTDPLHATPRADASRVVWLILGFMLILIFAFIIGFGLFITAVIMGAMGKIQPTFQPGELPHASAYLELVAVFLVAFITLQVLAGLLMPLTGLDLLLPVLLLSATTVFWPRLVGVSMKQYRQDMGLIAPKGVLKEVFAGLLGYLAGLPIVLIGGVLTAICSFVLGMQSEHPAGQEIALGSTYQLVVLILAIVVWAPLVEEMVFRAAFYRHLRRVPGVVTWLAATLLTSFVFAAIHPQGIVGIPLLMSIAIVLACLRQWRNSLIAPITAHAIHNGSIITLIVILLYL